MLLGAKTQAAVPRAADSVTVHCVGLLTVWLRTVSPEADSPTGPLMMTGEPNVMTAVLPLPAVTVAGIAGAVQTWPLPSLRRPEVFRFVLRRRPFWFSFNERWKVFAPRGGCQDPRCASW